jgi:hypothetical protein
LIFLLYPIHTLSLLVPCDNIKELDPTDILNYCSARYSSHQLKKGDYCLIRPERVRPTQVFVGKVEMECTKALLESYTSDQLRQSLMDEYVPAIIGPKGDIYITDHHHFAVALFQAFLDFQRPVIHRVLYACIQEDFSQLNKTTFWPEMIKRQFVFLEDERGNNITTNDLPVTLKLMADNPFRTLSNWLRKSKAWVKCGTKGTTNLMQCRNTTAPFFIECTWANYIRKYIPLTEYPSWPDLIPPLDDFIYRASLQLQVETLGSILQQAINLTLSSPALGLPGFNIERNILIPKMVKIDNHGCFAE